jgi:two-component system sensor histidine kinase KdpD
MRHGNVYPPDRTSVALERFFTESNLTALRELALRFVAGRVDAQLEGIGAATTGTVSERVLVLVENTPATPRALRRAAASAAVLRAPLLALVVETPATAAAPAEHVRRIREYLDDATDLGAEILVVEASDVAEGIVRIVRARRVTRLVLPYRSASTIERVRRSSLADRIIDQVPSLEVSIVADARETTDAYRVGRGD